MSLAFNTIPGQSLADQSPHQPNSLLHYDRAKARARFLGRSATSAVRPSVNFASSQLGLNNMVGDVLRSNVVSSRAEQAPVNAQARSFAEHQLAANNAIADVLHANVKR